MKKKLFIASIILLTSNINISAEQINEFECTPEEMAEVVKRSPQANNRIQQTSFSDFTKPFQQAAVAEKADKQPDEITSEDMEEHGGDLSCLNVDFSKIGDNVMGGLEKIGGLLQGGMATINDMVDDIMDDLSKGFCSRAANAVGGFIGDKIDEWGENAKKNMEDKIRENKLSKLLDEKGRDYLINEQIDDTFNDKKGLLKWRNGGLDKSRFDRGVKSIWKNELDDLYDDFDDQVEETIEGGK